MRGVGLTLLLMTTALAGCLGGDDAPMETDPLAQLRDSMQLPDGADLVEQDDHLIALWTEVETPFERVFTLPEGATMVRFIADPGEDGSVSVAMSHNDTGRRRCNQQTVVDFGASFTGPRSCSSVAAIDPPGTEWVVRASSDNVIDARIEFHTRQPDGPTAMLDLSQLSHATHDLMPTEGFYVPSFDGTQLWVEVTLPEGEGPWPTVIAASPYNGQQGRLPDPGAESNVGTAEATPAMWTYWTQDYAKRGYAAVNVDVRGFGKSGGCVEVWGENEQRDQAFIVDWVAQQDWSDGNVGFYGQSYVGTTPVAAAVQAPEALKAIIAVAPVIDAYFDWHYGGVPNGESSLSPVAYQVLTDDPSQWAAYGQEDPVGFGTDMPSILQHSAKGICDPTLVPLANDPRAIHGDYYDERDFGARAGDVEAAVLFTQGFEDANVKSAMIGDWFNDIEAPKLGVFGHWLHQHPARLDAEALFLGWMDHYVKGKDLGFDDLPDVFVSIDEEHFRTADAWPPVDAPDVFRGIDFDAGTLGGDGAGSVDLDMFPLSEVAGSNSATGPAAVTVTGPVGNDTLLVSPEVRLTGTLTGGNAMVYASLYEDRADGTSRLLTWGMQNLAVGNDHDTYAPLLPTDTFTMDLPLRPTEHLVAGDSTLRLTIRGVQAAEALGTAQPAPGQLTLDGTGTGLVFPDMPEGSYAAMPLASLP